MVYSKASGDRDSIAGEWTPIVPLMPVRNTTTFPGHGNAWQVSAPNPLYLRVDVCTYRGLREGAGGVLEVLRKTGARATFFVTFGPDRSGLALLKLLNPSFALRMVRNRAGSTYGLATAFYGTILPAPLVGAGLGDVVRRIRDEGHEVGAHGWDHRRWQDGLPRFHRERLREEFSLMVEAHRKVLGTPPASFAAPAWMVTADLLALEEEAELRFASDARGTRPFLPVFASREFKVPQLPVTLPTLDERLGRVTPERFVEETLDLARSQTEYACYTAHAETEGRAHRKELESILARLDRPVLPLGEAPLRDLPRRRMAMATIPGRHYPVCCEDYVVDR
jgi:peptidoglycan/xylan/chitin deacetylase (PgdA/CDA1 family)